LYHFLLPNLGSLGEKPLCQITEMDTENLIKMTSGLCNSSASQTQKFLRYFFNDMELANRIKENVDILKQRMDTKSRAGKRSIPVPDYVLDEIVVARERYKQKFEIVNEYEIDDGYIWHRDTGSPHNRYDYKKPFSELKKAAGIPDEFRWHDLRHTFATILANNHVNLKELSSILGHQKGEFTLNVYIDHPQIVYEGIPAYFHMLDSIMPIKSTTYGIRLKKPETQSLNRYIKFLEDVGVSITNDLYRDEKTRSPCQSR
jgi:hypothetical protein